MFLHEHPEFPDLIRIVSAKLRVLEGLVEKDYWVTHSLWSLKNCGLKVWFKGGTSLSKGYGLIERFSEDLDLKLDGPSLPPVPSWTAESKAAIRARQEYFRALVSSIKVAGTLVEELSDLRDLKWRNVVVAVKYPSTTDQRLPPVMRPFVQLEIGSARVTPGREVKISSWVYDHAVEKVPSLHALSGSCPSIHCVDPAVSLLEKVEAVSRRFRKEPFAPASFVRHYEDSCSILEKWDLLDDVELKALLGDLVVSGDIREWPPVDDPAFAPSADSRWISLERAWKEIESLYWGKRVPLAKCAARLRDLLIRLQL